MGGFDPAKVLMILLVAIIVLGPERLPRAARQLGGVWRELNRMRERFEEEVRGAIPDVEIPNIALPKRGITGYLTSMMSSSSGAEAGGAFSAEVVEGDIVSGEVVTASFDEQGPLLTQGWVSGSGELELPEGVPAGWNAVGAQAPGYASGSLLSSVPFVATAGRLGAEAELDFDEPGWN